jgi:hypothetical protein
MIDRFVSLIVLVLCVAYLEPAHAQIPEAAAAAGLVAIGKRTVGSVLDELNQQITNMAGILGAQADVTMGNAVIALHGVFQGVWLSLDKERDQIVNDIHDQRQQALVDAYVLMRISGNVWTGVCLLSRATVR